MLKLQMEPYIYAYWEGSFLKWGGRKAKWISLQAIGVNYLFKWDIGEERTDKQDFVRKFDWILDIAFRRSTLDSFSQERRPCIFGLPNLYEHLANCTCEVITNHEELNDQARANRISHLYLMDAVRR